MTGSFVLEETIGEVSDASVLSLCVVINTVLAIGLLVVGSIVVVVIVVPTIVPTSSVTDGSTVAKRIERIKSNF